ncbi:MAG: family 20 glycosylhydrolase [Chloroflexota bacterium]|nr:family 20 glycosylhydrolase [Chloroflexota bacterium]
MHYEGAQRLRRRNVTNYSLVLFGMVTALAILITLHSIVPAGLALVLPNSVPQVIPSLREWQGSTGSFTIVSTSRIVVDPLYTAQLQDTAHVFQADLFDVTEHPLPVVASSSPVPGDFYLTLKNTDGGIGNEGYRFEVGDVLAIRANTSSGIFYGTRTALQILLQDSARLHIVKGVARDYPKYKERGFMLDVARKFFSLGSLEDYVKMMSWYKMNDFHLHLNDNEIGAGDSPDWMHKYAAFRLNSDRFKGLAAKDGSYTRQDMRELQDVARQHGVTITPEIDTPAHALAFTQYRPDLASQKYSKEFLDLDNPSTYTFMNTIWDEFLPWFDTSQVHIGVDEYALSDADKYRQFIDTYDAYLKHKGKTAQMWGSLTKMQSAVSVDTDIVTDVWDNRWANPVDMVKQGFQVINANDNLLYIVPKAGYFHDYLDTKLLYEKWEPNSFDLTNPRLNLNPRDPHLLGGMFAEWNDKLGIVVSDADVYNRVKPAMQTLGEKMWSGTTTGTTYDQFQQLAATIGEAPGTNFPQ